MDILSTQMYRMVNGIENGYIDELDEIASVHCVMIHEDNITFQW